MAERTDRDDRTTTSAAAPEKFHRDRLQQEAELFFSVPSYVVAGALEGRREVNFTIAEVRRAIERWLNETPEGSK